MTTLTAKPIHAKTLIAKALTAYPIGTSRDGVNPLVWNALVANGDGVLVSQLVGEGTPTWAHTSSLLLPDWEGIYRTIPSGTAPITGARKVTNICLHSNDVTNAAWAKGVNTTVTAYEGGTRVQMPTGAGTYIGQGVWTGYVTLRASMKVKRGPSGSSANFVTGFAYGFGGVSTLTVVLTDDFQHVSFMQDVSALTYATLMLDGTGEMDFIIKEIMVENVTGQSNQNPGEYVPTTTAAASKFFNYENGNTVDGSNVVTEATGDPLTDWWFQCQPAKTNKALYSNDASNAAWVKTDMTGAKDAVGLDGAPNTGSTLTATGANATAIQTVTSASADHVARFFLRRKTGTGTVNICCDGSTWTEAVLTADYQEFMVLANTTNPQIGVQIVTSGDAVEMGNGECYTATIPVIRGSSPILTAASTVSTTAVYGTFDIANHSDSKGAYMATVKKVLSSTEQAANAAGGQIIAGNRLYYADSSAAHSANDGTTTVSVTDTWAADATVKVGVAYQDGGNMVAVQDGTAGTPDSYDGDWSATFTIGASANKAPILIKDVRRYNLSYTAGLAKLEEITGA